MSVRHRWVTCVLGIFDHFQYCLHEAFLSETKFDAFSDESHLLTATHCINQYRPEELRVSGEAKILLKHSFALFSPQIRLGEWDVHTDTEFHPNLEMDILSVRSIILYEFSL